MERKNILLIVIIVLIAAGIFVVKRYLGKGTDCDKLSFNISDQSIMAGGSIQFEDNTPKASSWNWNFGIGEGSSNLKSGDYIYTKAGDYDVTLTVNGKCTGTIKIKVNDMKISSEDTTQKVVEIKGPSSCQVGEKIHFENNMDGASSWDWQFGESGNIDSKVQNPDYTYTRPGSYTVVLQTNGSKKEGRHKITVNYKPADPGSNAPKRLRISDADLKAKFEKILAGGFAEVYKDMIKKYFADNENVTVEINGSEKEGIQSYCLQLRIQHQLKISDVKVIYDNAGYISKVLVTQK